MIVIGADLLSLSAFPMNDLSTYADLSAALSREATLAASREAFLTQPPRLDDANTCLVMQGERATAFAEQFEWLASDDATTCHIVAFRNTATRCTALAHLDGFGDDLGSLRCMLKDVVIAAGSRDDVERTALQDADLAALDPALLQDAPPIDVYVVGGYDDERSISHRIAGTLVRALHELPARFRVVLYCSMAGNTLTKRAADHAFRFRDARDDDTIALPRAISLAVCPRTGDATTLALTAALPSAAAAPLYRLRRSAVFASARALGRSPHAIQVFDRFRGIWCIPPLTYNAKKRNLDHYSDEHIRFDMSTSPLAERATFEAAVRDTLHFLNDNPDWHTSFPTGKSRLFERETGNEIVSS
jgi:hypothetical protein